MRLFGERRANPRQRLRNNHSFCNLRISSSSNAFRRSLEQASNDWFPVEWKRRYLQGEWSQRHKASPSSVMTLRGLGVRGRSARRGMEGGAADYNPRTPEDVFRDFRSRRAGMIKALTTDVEKFYQQCDPEKENLCLYGLPNETWEVNLPAEEVPAELPEPALGINFARDGMAEKDWLSLVAVHSDAWLLSVAFYFGARFGFDKEARKRLFHMINGLPTIYEVVTGTSRKQSKERTNNSSKSNKSGLKNSRQSESYTKASKTPPPKDGAESEGEDNEDMEEHGNTLCGACGDNYATDEFWICCDVCEKWYHGKCVKITPARAEHIKQYKCPGCSTKRARA